MKILEIVKSTHCSMPLKVKINGALREQICQKIGSERVNMERRPLNDSFLYWKDLSHDFFSFSQTCMKKCLLKEGKKVKIPK